MAKSLNFGVIGYGYWGPNIVRNLMSLEDSQVLAIAEMSPICTEASAKSLSGHSRDFGRVGRDLVDLR